MNNFNFLQSLSLDELATWLDKYGQFDDSPWMSWFNENYCDKCESIECSYTEYGAHIENPYNRRITFECSYCELENKCKFFLEFDDILDNKDIIKLWLNSEYNKESDSSGKTAN